MAWLFIEWNWLSQILRQAYQHAAEGLLFSRAVALIIYMKRRLACF